MVRKVNVRGHVRELSDGRETSVKPHKRSVPFSSNLDTLSEKWALAFIKKRMSDTFPDGKSTSRIVFLYPNQLWAQHPDKYDVYRLDCDEVPEYKKVPEKGWPHQLIKVKGKFYIADDKNGKFKRHFPPKEVDKFAKFINKTDFVEDKQGNLRTKQLEDYSRDELRIIAKKKEIKNYSKYNKKQLGNLIVAEYTREQKRVKDLKEEIKWLKQMEKEPGLKAEIRGMIEARQHDLKHLI